MILSGAIKHLSGDSTDPYLENDLSTSTEATGVARYALADAVSFNSRFSTERQKEVTFSDSDSRAAISMYACHSSAAQDRDAMTLCIIQSRLSLTFFWFPDDWIPRQKAVIAHPSFFYSDWSRDA